jgi:hypothetical protein
LGKLNLILDKLNDLKAGGGGAPHRPRGGAGVNRCRGIPQSLATSRFTV